MKTRPFLTANGDEHCTCTSLSVRTHRDRPLHLALCRVPRRDGFAPVPATLLGVIQSPKRLGECGRGGTLERHIRLLVNDPHPSVNTCYCHRPADGDGWKPLPPWWRRARWLARFHTDEHIGQKWHFNELCPVLSAACRPLIAGWPRCALPLHGACSLHWLTDQSAMETAH